MRRKSAADININHERWLVSYADFMTLLFAFFVVMYSISQVNESKYRVLSATLTEIFSQSEKTLMPIQVGELSRSGPPQILDKPIANSDSSSQGAFDKTADLPQLSDQFSERFADFIDDKVVQVNSNEYWLQISLNNSVLFPLGSIKPKRQARKVLAEMADLLRGFNNPIQVEGYTDNIPVNSSQFPSNWELSSARAVAVVKVLINEGIAPVRLAAVGYGEHQAIAENLTAEGRAQNRRVVLMIAREKIQRPRVSTVKAIDHHVNSPQPGLEQGNKAVTTSENWDIDEKLDRLSELNPGLGIDSLLQQEDKNPKKNLDSRNNPLIPIETKTGGLLFTNDPDLPRKSNE